ncbi:molybdopterin binding domain protein [Desulfotomaculum nigrificans CO-1-SRB]|uniref:Molybdopterin binding domain protein n=1 Tax=Desulfotomaculum nigrificans (strain DSM 14880 / VKM B-2319 / CO-1-SRB) TaxID=868595 RepID=F6B8S9_DESCC|nr:molybdopterin-binding protein [Desulfotomaculum nigrificans]AEF94772.1 molybdopterin binding domain protein [Desulfotomaculum nigrificans CO-1-SRB]
MEWDLLEKTTFWIEGIDLEGANLGEVAKTAALALEMKPDDIMVVDVRPGLVAFDVLRRQVKAESIVGKEKEILRQLGNLAGVKLDASAVVHSEGVLGLIALGEKEGFKVLTESERMAADISKAVSLRAIVFASGSEVIAGKIEDTNSPYILQALEQAGYKTKFGGILEDNAQAAASGLEAALEQGYGLIITTGGVGAEDKDFSIEAICRLDPDAATPWILKFKPDYHRHHKEGVRIAVGQVGIARMVALPGPHEEAKLGCNRLIEGLRAGLDKSELAEYIAGAIRDRWQNMMKKGGQKHGSSHHSS